MSKSSKGGRSKTSKSLGDEPSKKKERSKTVVAESKLLSPMTRKSKDNYENSLDESSDSSPFSKGTSKLN